MQRDHVVRSAQLDPGSGGVFVAWWVFVPQKHGTKSGIILPTTLLLAWMGVASDHILPSVVLQTRVPEQYRDRG